MTRLQKRSISCAGALILTLMLANQGNPRTSTTTKVTGFVQRLKGSFGL